MTKARTLKVLKKVSAQEMKEKSRKGKSIRSAAELETYLDKLAENCEGDLRKALFTLEFFLLGNDSKAEDFGFADPSLTFFHALGKILYNKPSGTSLDLDSESKKKRKLVGKHGDSEVVEDILRALKGVETDQEFSTFRTFLHSHYTSFFPSTVSDLEKSSSTSHPLDSIEPQPKKTKSISSTTTTTTPHIPGNSSLLLTQAMENTWQSAEWISFAEMMTDSGGVTQAFKKDSTANESLATLLACRGVQENGIGRTGGEGIGKPFHRPPHLTWRNRSIAPPPPLLTFKSKIICQEQLWYTELGPFWAKISTQQHSPINSFVSKNGLTPLLNEIGKFSAPNQTLDLKLAPLSSYQKQAKKIGVDSSDARAQLEKKKINMSQAVLLSDDIQEF